ncbi:tyrosine-protein kinase SRK2-like [Haliotis cracherodii]|uniref:tyrosine-protein kinase SRK2-like n=1 Tax=Haliotis cracherodii TaxID=6455 RepID=UPI0039E8A719
MTRRNNIDNEYNMVSTMKALRHVRLVQLLAVCVDFEPMLLIMEYMSNGSLHDFLRATDSPNLEFNMAKNMCGQIAEGRAFLESKSYIHGDLRSANILIGEHHTVKIAYAWQGKEDTQDGENRYPTKWMAPEAALYNKRSIKSDVWSFGVLMYEIASAGIIPFSPIVNLHKVFREILEGYRLPKPTTHWPPEQLDRYYDIIQPCWKHDRSDRPSFVHVQEKQHDL